MADVNPGRSDSNPAWLTVVGEELFFVATGPNGRELYKVVPEPTGTTLVLAGLLSVFVLAVRVRLR